MEITRLNMVYHLLLRNTTLCPNTKGNNVILKPINKIYFVICNSCYWCASYFGFDYLEILSESPSHVLDCHICDSCNTELIPISPDESFRIRYNQTRGMEIEFNRNNNIVPRQVHVQSNEPQRQIPKIT
jgi:hypothetical protein